MIRRIKKLKDWSIRTNKRIKNGFDHVSWLFYVLTGGTIITYALSGLGLNALVPASAVPIGSIIIFWIVGKTHEKEAKP